MPRVDAIDHPQPRPGGDPAPPSPDDRPDGVLAATGPARRIERGSIWCGVAFTALFAVGFAIAGFIPPPAPTTPAQELARDVAAHADRMRAGVQVSWAAGVLFLPWIAVVSQVLRRIEGPGSIMARVQLGAGIGSTMLFVIPMLQLQAALLRPERSPEVTQAMQDLVWMPFVGSWAVPAAQCVAIAVAVLADPRPVPLLPRWVAYFNAWVALAYVPAIAMPFFHEGPLSWRGLLPWWLGAIAFFAWIVVMSAVLLRAPAARPATVAPAGRAS